MLPFMISSCAKCVCLFASQEENLYSSQSWPDHRTRRPEMAQPGLSRSRSRNQKRKYHNRMIHGSIRDAQAYLPPQQIIIQPIYASVISSKPAILWRPSKTIGCSILPPAAEASLFLYANCVGRISERGHDAAGDRA